MIARIADVEIAEGVDRYAGPGHRREVELCAPASRVRIPFASSLKTQATLVPR